MMKLKTAKRKIATLSFLKQLVGVPEHSGNFYIVKIKDKKYCLLRIGKCEPKKCKSICCKFIHFGRSGTSYCNYTKHFGRTGKIGTILDIKCGMLTMGGKCKLWGKKAFPNACKQFPHPSDELYLEVMHVCGFKFEIVGEFK